MGNKMAEQHLIELFLECQKKNTLGDLSKALINERYFDQYTLLSAMIVEQYRAGLLKMTIDLLKFIYSPDRGSVPFSYMWKHQALVRRWGTASDNQP